MSQRALSALLIGIGLAFVQPAHALTGSALELGAGDDSTRMARVALRWNWDRLWRIGQGWNATGFWEVGLGLWDGDGDGARKLWDFDVTPVFRLSPNDSNFYLEGAIGAHFLSKTRINDKRDFGCSFNFGDHVGFGWSFGGRNRYDLGYRFQHVSNAELAKPNDGINFHQIRFGINY